MSIVLEFLNCVIKGSGLTSSVVLSLLTIDAMRSEMRNEKLTRYLTGFAFLFVISLVIRGLI